eukprot:jgi/Chrzof1/6213/Cz17g15220.t1
MYDPLQVTAGAHCLLRLESQHRTLVHDVLSYSQHCWCYTCETAGSIYKATIWVSSSFVHCRIWITCKCGITMDVVNRLHTRCQHMPKLFMDGFEYLVRIHVES